MTLPSQDAIREIARAITEARPPEHARELISHLSAMVQRLRELDPAAIARPAAPEPKPAQLTITGKIRNIRDVRPDMVTFDVDRGGRIWKAVATDATAREVRRAQNRMVTLFGSVTTQRLASEPGSMRVGHRFEVESVAVAPVGEKVPA